MVVEGFLRRLVIIIFVPLELLDLVCGEGREINSNVLTHMLILYGEGSGTVNGGCRGVAITPR